MTFTSMVWSCGSLGLYSSSSREMDDRWLSSESSNGSCSGDLDRESCLLTQSHLGFRDTISAIRMILSTLSILGTISIIFSVIARKQLRNPKVHPIFVLSVADLILALLWIVGGVLWLRRAPSRAWCYVASLPTVILYCVTVNLTLVYALLAYSTIKQKENHGYLLSLSSAHPDRVWHPIRVFLAYFIAWTFPTVAFIMFMATEGSKDRLLEDAASCSCWCLPVYGNVLPFASPKDDMPTAVYISGVRKLVAFSGWMVGTNYLVVFVLLVIVYYKILKSIKRIRSSNAAVQSRESHETQALIMKGESKARKRVMYFLTTFMITGFSNFLLSYAIAIFTSVRLSEPVQDHTTLAIDNDTSFRGFLYKALFILESVTLPIQGFLNAIVYGWTREDFVYLVSLKSQLSERELEESMEETLEGAEDSGILTSSTKQEGRGRRFTQTFVDTDSGEDSDHQL